MACACAQRPFLLAPSSPLSARLRVVLGASSVAPSPPSALRAALAGVVIGVTAAAAGLLLGQLSAPSSPGNNSACETCNGAGYVECVLCTRWSGGDGGGGCASCRGSQRTRCPRCRGGGMLIPSLARVLIPVRIDEGINSVRRFATLCAGVLTILPARAPRRARAAPPLAFISPCHRGWTP